MYLADSAPQSPVPPAALQRATPGYREYPGSDSAQCVVIIWAEVVKALSRRPWQRTLSQLKRRLKLLGFFRGSALQSEFSWLTAVPADCFCVLSLSDHGDWHKCARLHLRRCEGESDRKAGKGSW